MKTNIVLSKASLVPFTNLNKYILNLLSSSNKFKDLPSIAKSSINLDDIVLANTSYGFSKILRDSTSSDILVMFLE